MEAPIRPTAEACGIYYEDNIFNHALQHPETVFDHPDDVVTDPKLSLSERRAILASWASDASPSLHALLCGLLLV